MMGISSWLGEGKDLMLKEKEFTESKGPQRKAVLEKQKKIKKKKEEEKEDKEEEKHKKKHRINKPTN
jgi:hypothetical protein